MTAPSCLVLHSEGSLLRERLTEVLSFDRPFSFQLIDWERLASDYAHPGVAADHADIVVALGDLEIAPVVRLFEWAGAHPVGPPILAVLPDPTEEWLIAAASRVAADFIVLPARDEEIRQRVARMIAPDRSEPHAVSDRLMIEAGLRHLVGQDPAFTRVIAQLPQIARSDMPVLVSGETGTGKELCARAVHHLSRRRDHSFVAVDCGSVPDHLFENELFGHLRGAFTDAHRDQRGLVGMAQGGTLFLDEIDALSLAAQAKLLRLLQERVYRPLGSDRFVGADINVIAATNQDLTTAVRDHRFRSDLFYRLNVLSLALPPLRDRRADILTLAHLFLREARVSTGTGPVSFSPAAQSMLVNHDWPGNIRELQNVVRRAAVACQSRQVLPGDLPLAAATTPSTPRFRMARAEAVSAFERRYVEELLHKHHGNVTHAALEAQKDRRAFGRLVKKYGIQKPRPIPG